MSAKKAMFVIWLVGSILWGMFCTYMFDLKAYVDSVRMYEIYEARYYGGTRDPMAKAQMNSAARRVYSTNKNLVMFIVFAVAFPALLLSVGTWAMGAAEPKKSR